MLINIDIIIYYFNYNYNNANSAATLMMMIIVITIILTKKKIKLKFYMKRDLWNVIHHIHRTMHIKMNSFISLLFRNEFSRNYFFFFI